MPFDAFFTGLARGKVKAHASILLPDENSAPMTGGGYFQVRLVDMSLAFGRQWHQEVVPATFVLADYNYGGKPIRHPFFVSNAMVDGLPTGIMPATLRMRLRNTMVVGPTPYVGGDVALFVGLFKSVIADRRKEAFGIFEQLFSKIDVLGFSQYLNIANKLSETIFSCLGAADIECVLAERRVLIQGEMPSSRTYLILLSSTDKQPVDTQGLSMHGDELIRKSGTREAPPEDLDFCVLSIEHIAQRNDYAAFPFHALWQQARAKMVGAQVAEAQALMLECASQIFSSADLSEEHKVDLIEFYQARLLAVKNLLSPRSGTTDAVQRGEEAAPARLMQAHALAVQPALDSKRLDRHFHRIDALSRGFNTSLSRQPEPDAMLTDLIMQHLTARQAHCAQTGDAAFLAHALAAGSVQA